MLAQREVLLQWMVSFIPKLQAYLIRNLGSGRYVTSEYDVSNGGLIQGIASLSAHFVSLLTLCSASQLPRIWAIKQSEASEEFM